MKTIKFFGVGLLGILALFAKAQDAHLSQFDATPVVLNPASTGVNYKGDYRIGTQYRNQWGTMGSKFSTLAVGYDMPMMGTPQKERWGLGGYIFDADGARIINSFSFVLSGAYKIMDPKQSKHLLTTGIQLGFIVKSANENNLIFDQQYTEGTFDPDLPTGESFNKTSLFMPEINWGISYIMLDNEKRFRPYGGLSLFHITTPKETFFKSDDSRLPRRWVLNGGCRIKITDQIIVDPNFLFMLQRNSHEYVVGLRGFYKMNDEYAFTGGVNWRIKDAVYPMLGIYYRNIVYQISYDFNISGLKEYTNSHGAIEFAIIFVNRKAGAKAPWF